MAASRPMGIATSIATAVIMKVPANSGTEPNWAALPPSSARPAASRKLAPGFQVVPVMKSQKFCIWKKRRASPMIDTSMPRVVKMEISAAPASRKRITRSMAWRAWKSGRTISMPMASPRQATARLPASR